MSILLIVNEFKTFTVAQAYFGFLGFHAGRGLLFCFLGCLVMNPTPFNVIVSIITCTVGLGYLILSFLPQMPPPNAFCVHWQHHQDFWAEGLDLPPPPPPQPSHPPMTNIITVTPPHPSTWHPKVRY
ncbi:hypothetical protein LRAMOSA07680 [Lichtheimia ramosa]|uniref:Uncharacterized protein n=1 Tax=Lichtheimia ramosa TaxID=688394 RepID=A0A077WBP5_9FUNG|nr:hypothetical protein LRAMOSA07680 [Lichtheimia ramosa]